MTMSCVNGDNFLGVALVINRSRDGPAFVFHYPSDVRAAFEGTGGRDPDPEDILLERLSQPASRDAVAAGAGAAEDQSHQWDRDGRMMDDSSGAPLVPWEHVAGFPTRDLAGILTPARSYHKKLFQLSLDPLHCVAYPIHVPENGKWKNPKKAGKVKSNSGGPDEMGVGGSNDAESLSTKPSEPSRDKEEDIGKDVKKDERDEEKRSSMTMFNLVFFLNPGQSDVKELVDTLYTHIVKKANKAYKYSQQHSDFIWKESKRIILAKDKARDEKKKMSTLWKEILGSSSLAASMQDIYNAVSQNKIAALHLETAAGVITPSFQIPVPFFVTDVAQNPERGQQGLWLTTANTLLGQDSVEESGFHDRNFALLLMDDEKKIISELQAEPDSTTMSMVEFVRLSKPTTSFHQVAQSGNLTIEKVRKYAQHFIYWRRAIAIPPLHARDVYTLSPNCDPRRLPQDSQEWQRLFPVAPALPNFLSELSHSPRPYKHYCPSKAHRPSYLSMLAWLMRRGWVTQLCTFAYIIVWPEILYEVDYEMEAEELAASEKAREEQPSAAPAPAEDEQPVSPTATAMTASTLTMPSTITGSSTSDYYTPAPASASSDAGAAAKMSSAVELSAERARLERIATKAHREATERTIAHARKVAPLATAHPSLNDAPHLKGLSPHIILDPKKATGKEARYLSAIGRRFQGDRVRSAWNSFCKYFDGRWALERIALQEEMRRKEVWTLLTAMTEYIMTTRHW